jgi:hypothetical protein
VCGAPSLSALDHADVDDNQTVADNTTPGSVRQKRLSPGEFYLLALQEVILSMIERTTLHRPAGHLFSHASTASRAQRVLPRAPVYL